MDEYLIQGSTLTDIADAIREKTGDDALMTPAEMVEAIASISGGSGVQAVFNGTVTFVGQDVHSITVPISGISLTGNEVVFGIGRALRTGEIVNGDVVWYQNLTVPLFSTSASNGWTPHFISTANLYFYTDAVYYANGTANTRKTAVVNNAYRMWNNNNGGVTGGINASINTTRNTITISANAQWLCRTSSAAEYEYIIFVMCRNGTYY